MGWNRAYGRLQSDIKNIIEEDIPLNLHCSYCEHDLEPETIIDRSAKVDAREWDMMADRVIKQVVDALPQVIEEVS